MLYVLHILTGDASRLWLMSVVLVLSRIFIAYDKLPAHRTFDGRLKTYDKPLKPLTTECVCPAEIARASRPSNYPLCDVGFHIAHPLKVFGRLTPGLPWHGRHNSHPLAAMSFY